MARALFRLTAAALRLAFLLLTAAALVGAGIGYGLYRLLGGRRPLSARARRRGQAARVWLHVRVPGLGGRRCPHCGIQLDPGESRVLCPQCYGDLVRTCPGCGEAVGVQRRFCPHCEARLSPPAGRPREEPPGEPHP